MSTAARIRRPRRPEGAPALAAYITVDDVMRATAAPLSTAYKIMDRVAALAGLDLSTRATKAKRLPLAAWEAHSAAVLSPPRVEGARQPPPRVATPPRPAPRALAGDEAPAVPLSRPRHRAA